MLKTCLTCLQQSPCVKKTRYWISLMCRQNNHSLLPQQKSLQQREKVFFFLLPLICNICLSKICFITKNLICTFSLFGTVLEEPLEAWFRREEYDGSIYHSFSGHFFFFVGSWSSFCKACKRTKLLEFPVWQWKKKNVDHYGLWMFWLVSKNQIVWAEQENKLMGNI